MIPPVKYKPIFTPLNSYHQRRFKELRNRFSFGHDPAFLIEPNKQGFNHLAFGGRAGPSLNVSHTLHEMAHAVQFKPEEFRWRVTRYGFHFKHKRVFCFGQRYTVFETHAPLMRELEVFGIELTLRKMAGYASHKGVVDTMLRVAKYIPGYNNTPPDFDSRAVIMSFHEQWPPDRVERRFNEILAIFSRRIKYYTAVTKLTHKET